MNTGTLNFEELGVMLVFCVALLMLVNRVPPLVAGVISGTGIGNAGGIGNFGAGAAIGAAMGAASMAAGAAGMAGSAIMGAATSAAGGASAIKAAFEKVAGSAGGGSGEIPSFGGLGGDSGAGSPGDAGTGRTPFAQAAGFGGSSLGGGSSSKSGSDKGADKATKSEPKPSGAGQQGGAAPGSTGLLASAASALGTAGRIAADTGANLAKGTTGVAKAKAASIRDAALERIADTTGGKIAAAIKAQGSGGADQIDTPAQPAPTFGGDSLAAGSRDADPESEVAAFVNRDDGTKEG
jgi:type IV secretion system protein TrbL